jgi:ArsR family transcriptional regulator, arsenate/arsenite/antimonite-responsive transcriptional repressor
MKMENPDDLSFQNAAASFAALGSEQRLSVLRALVRAAPAGLSIGVLGERCGIAGSTLTFHVKILVQAGLVRQARSGRHIFCAANTPAIRGLSDFLLSECCVDSDFNVPPLKDASDG